MVQHGTCRDMFGNSQHVLCYVSEELRIVSLIVIGLEFGNVHCDWWAHVDLDERLESGDGSRRRSAGRSGLRAGGTYCSGPGETIYRARRDYLCIYNTMTYLLRKLIRKACAVTIMVVSLNRGGIQNVQNYR